MSIVRVRKDEKYFTASNEVFNDPSISWEARGLMGYLLSKPNGWEVRMADLEAKGPAGNHKLRRMLAELRQHGYMNRIRITNPDKTFSWETEVFESPSQNPRPSVVVQKASCRFSTSGSSTSGKVPDVLSTEESNTKKESKSRKQKQPLSQEGIDKANKAVDFILENARKAKYEHSEKFPAGLDVYADLYVELTGQKPHKKFLMDWISTFDEWRDMGLKEDHIRQAYKDVSGWSRVDRPGRLTRVAYSIACKPQAAIPGLPPMYQYQEDASAVPNPFQRVR